MTGFGRGTFATGQWHASVEASTVNRKQAEIVVQMPRELAELENTIRKLAQAHISRGRLQLSVALTHASGTAPAIQVNEPLARAFREAFTTLSSATGHLVEPSAADYLRQPGILDIGTSQIDPAEAWLAIEPALQSALEALSAMREAEGTHLRGDILARLSSLEQLASTFAAAAPDRPIRQRDLLLKRLADSGLALDPADERVAKEIALFADRCDISEELTRLTSHIARFREYLDSAEPPGRALDFLCQELFRECNTVGSKANDSAIAHTVVEAKTELEKIREQVQNIE
jgi:uncharacterized protein (TIGR00255 family)